MKHRPHKITNDKFTDSINTLVALFNQGRCAEAEALAKELTVLFPQNGAGWKVLGVMLALQGRKAEALEPMRKAAELLPRDAEAHNNLGNTLRDQGRLAEAEASYRQVLIIRPDYAEAHGNLGNTLRDQGRLAEAEASYRQVLIIRPDYAEAHNDLGNTLRDQGRLAEAEASYRRALIIKPDYAEAHGSLGNTLRDQGRLAEAEASYRQVLIIRPDYAEVHNSLGVTLLDQGRLAEAEASLRLALFLKPDYAVAHSNLGVTLQEQGRLTEAEASYRRALIIKPDYAKAYNNLGGTLKDQGRLAEAEASYRRALIIKPDYAEVHNSLGVTLLDQGRLAEAEASLRQALIIKPDYAVAHNNLGVTLQEQGRLAEAEASLRQALIIKPDYAVAHNNLGVTLRGQRRFAEAEASLRQALIIKPDYAEAYSNLGGTLKDQGRLAEAEASYRQALIIKPDYAEAYSNLLFALSYNPDHRASHYLEEASRYGRMAAKKVEMRFSAWQCVSRPERLRVGFVSGDLRNHPVGYFLESVLAQIDPSRMELIAYPTDYKADELTARITPYFSAWKPLVGLSDKAAAGLIHGDGIHVLLDCSGHTAKNRLPVFAWKPAPVQASWLGYSATTGLAEMDYLLGDPYVTPAGEEGHFTETVWRLPETYQCLTPPDVPLKVGPLPALSSGSITFGSFNNLVKVNDAVVTLWAKVLKAVSGSRLFLKAKQLNDPGVRDTTRQRFAAWGITPDRLVLEGTSQRAKTLEAHNRVDIILSPFPYPGVTTSAEGVWMGVPVITRRGDCFLHHMGESIAHNAGLADWIAEDDDDYVAKAIQHTADLGRLAALRNILRQQVLASPLFDAPRFARHLEAALWGMWERWQSR
jgi:predicted O-linked N-acetylglucosamine transferase (SPINDLY family)